MPVVFIRIESSVSESIDPVNPMKMIARLSVIIVNTMTTLSTQRIATLCLRIIDVLVDVKQLQTIHHDGENTRCQRVAQEKHEELHIPVADAVVGPGTVVIHAHNATVATTTVVGTRRFVGITLHAEEEFVLVRTTRAVGRIGGNGSWICKGAFASPSSFWLTSEMRYSCHSIQEE